MTNDITSNLTEKEREEINSNEKRKQIYEEYLKDNNRLAREYPKFLVGLNKFPSEKGFFGTGKDFFEDKEKEKLAFETIYTHSGYSLVYETYLIADPEMALKYLKHILGNNLKNSSQ